MSAAAPQSPPSIRGIHHVTAIASDPQANHDFYTHALGLRLVKRTVNFDDPGTYHFYFGDERGTPGTILTFFPWPGARAGRRGSGQATVTGFLVPPGSLEAWRERLLKAEANVETPMERFGLRTLRVYDNDDLQLELVEHEDAARVEPWSGPGDHAVPAEMAIRGFFGVTLCVRDLDATARLLVEEMGFRHEADDQKHVRYVAAGEPGVPGRRVDLVFSPDASPGIAAAGTVHHVAFRVADAQQQERWLAHLTEAGHYPTPVQERQYFRSVYFREPSGVLFELATDGPGFTIDEPLEHLGESLKLPEWFEPRRERIEQVLPPLVTGAVEPQA